MWIWWAEMANTVGLEVNRAFLDLPVHTGFTLPDFQRLLFSEATAQVMPRGSANVSHLFDEMSLGKDSLQIMDGIASLSSDKRRVFTMS